MKKITFYFALFLAFITIISSCTKEQQAAIAGTMEADVSGGTHYKATDVNGQVGASPNLPGKTQLTISSSMGSRTLTVAVVDYDENNPLGTYNFSGNVKKAIGGYNTGSGGGDDIIINGTLQITTTAAGHLTQGSFTGTTQRGIQLTTGIFSVTY
jgi:hypothetical protein